MDKVGKTNWRHRIQRFNYNDLELAKARSVKYFYYIRHLSLHLDIYIVDVQAICIGLKMSSVTQIVLKLVFVCTFFRANLCT